MNRSDASTLQSSFDLVLDAHAERATILAQIDALERDSANLSANRDTIHILQQKYNAIAYHLSQLEHCPTSDPMDVLPLELWTDIIHQVVNNEDPVEELLDLITVSKAWCYTLASLPTLWTSVVLDSTKDDYMAKAATSISLSGTCELSVHIYLSFDTWREVSSIVLAESGRIGSLHIYYPNANEGIRIFEVFSELPILRILHLPCNTTPFDTHRLQAIKFDQMPSLERITGLSPGIDEKSWFRFLTSYSVRVHAVQQDMLESWAGLPNLRTLQVTEDATALENLPKNLDSSLLSVRQFVYYGNGVDRALSWIGPNLTQFETRTAILPDVFVSISRFHRLNKLDLGTSTEIGHNPNLDRRIALPTLRSVKDFRVSSLGSGWRRGAGDDSLEPLNNLYRAFITSLPFVERFTARYTPFTETGCLYIASLVNLRRLHFSHCNVYITADPYPAIPLVNLEYIRCSGIRIPMSFLSHMVAPKLHRVFFNATWRANGTDLLNSAHCTMPEEVCWKLAHLTITIDGPILWKLGVQANLRTLEIVDPYYDIASLISLGDILETILMRPGDFPLLEKIVLPGRFLEWDLLIFMLERKNLYAPSGFVRIKTIVLRERPSYHLLYPITALLQGLFPERDANVLYSLEAIGERMRNESSTGCNRCCYAFRPCAMPTEPDGSTYRDSSTKNIDWNDNPASERLVAHPPLRPDVKEWLAGKDERRQHHHAEAEHQFRRIESCAGSNAYEKRRSTPVTITGSSLGTDYAFDAWDGHSGNRGMSISPMSVR